MLSQVLRASEGHVVRLRPPGALPDALSTTLYVAFAMPALSPFVPIYKVRALQSSPALLFLSSEEGRPLAPSFCMYQPWHA